MHVCIPNSRPLTYLPLAGRQNDFYFLSLDLMRGPQVLQDDVVTQSGYTSYVEGQSVSKETITTTGSRRVNIVQRVLERQRTMRDSTPHRTMYDVMDEGLRPVIQSIENSKTEAAEREEEDGRGGGAEGEGAESSPVIDVEAGEGKKPEVPKGLHWMKNHSLKAVLALAEDTGRMNMVKERTGNAQKRWRSTASKLIQDARPQTFSDVAMKMMQKTGKEGAASPGGQQDNAQIKGIPDVVRRVMQQKRQSAAAGDEAEEQGDDPGQGVSARSWQTFSSDDQNSSGNESSGAAMITAAKASRVSKSAGSPKPSSSPRPSGSPRPSSSPRPSGSPKPSSSPRPSGSPKPSSSPRPSGSPKPSSSPRPSRSPKPDRSAKPSRPAYNWSKVREGQRLLPDDHHAAEVLPLNAMAEVHIDSSTSTGFEPASLEEKSQEAGPPTTPALALTTKTGEGGRETETDGGKAEADAGEREREVEIEAATQF